MEITDRTGWPAHSYQKWFPGLNWNWTLVILEEYLNRIQSTESANKGYFYPSVNAPGACYLIGGKPIRPPVAVSLLICRLWRRMTHMML